jgi:hypothetical protein
MSERFNIVFAGEVAPNADVAAVRANLGRLFNAPEPVLDRLFSGQRVILKKALDQAAAMRLRAQLKQAGAIAHMVACDAEGKPLAAAPVPASAPAAPARPVPAAPVAPARPAPVAAQQAPARPATPPPTAPAAKPETMVERLARLAAEQDAKAALRPKPDAPPPDANVADMKTWVMYPPGSILAVAKEIPAPRLPDLSHLAMAAPGTDLVRPEERREAPPVIVTVPEFGVAAAGSDLLNASERKPEVPEVPAPVLDVAPPGADMLLEAERAPEAVAMVEAPKLGIAAAGSDLGQIREEKPPVKPDISHLKLA